MRNRPSCTLIVALAALMAISLVAFPVEAAPDPDRVFASDAEALAFLRNAEIISMEAIPVGVTRPRKVLLELDGARAHAVFRDVDLSRELIRLSDGSLHMKLHDSALFEVAAYRLAVLLGIDNVPPAVVRRVDNTRGSLQLWVNGAMSESHRRTHSLPLPDRGKWLQQMRLMSLFDCIVGNIDRNTGNYLHATSGKIWFIDHTRGFQMFPRDWSPRAIAFLQPELWERLQGLDAETLHQTMGDVLSKFEIDRLVERLDGVVTHVRRQITARGERQVIR